MLGKSLEAIFAEHPDQVAAVILEPMTFEEPADGFLERVRDLAHRNGAVLIFDEIITGFRLALGRRAGFVEEGVLRSHSIVRGQRKDMVMMALLPSDLDGAG